MRSPLDQVIQGLSHDPNLLQLKKLLFYSCRQTWETDPNQLNQYDLNCLVQELGQHRFSLEQLKAHLYRLAKTLSKPADYILIADALVNHLEPLYLETVETQVDEGWQAYVDVAQQLEQEADPQRVRKLLYAACKQTWENDPAVLSQKSLVEMVQELYCLTSTPQSLEAILNNIVDTLNRQVEYRQIAQTIAIACSPLYPSLTESTQILSAPAPAPTPALPPVTPSLSTLFDLRLEVMKYANPLRAKVLLFSALHGSVDYTPPLWDRLKIEGLDDLLSHLLRRYPIFAELQTQLPSTARLLPERDIYTHVSDVILRALKPCYANGRAVGGQPTVVPEAELTRAANPQDVTGIVPDPNAPLSEITGIQAFVSADVSADPSADALP